MLLRSLLLTGAINGLFFILLLQTKHQKSKADTLLSVWMGLIATQLFFYYDNTSGHPILPYFVQLLAFSIPLLSSPVLYFYIKGLAFGEPYNIKKKLIHLLPYVLFNFICLYLNVKHPNAITLTDGLPHFDIGIYKSWTYLLPGLLAIIPGYYSIAGLFVLIKYQQTLPHNYSYTEKITLNWLKWMVTVLLLLFAALFILIKYGVTLGWITYHDLFKVVGAVLTLYVFFIGYLGFRQHSFINTLGTLPQMPVEEDEEPVYLSYKNTGLSDERAAELFEILNLHMKTQQPYLNDTLSLRMLAAQLHITPNQLSQVINQKARCNFFAFINQYRVEAVKAKLANPAMAHYSILSIAFDCGFKSKSAFNKIFKQATGLTPLEYQKHPNG